MANRTRRFSWEEIINLDTAEHIATRLIERLVEIMRLKVTRRSTTEPFSIEIPNLRQFEYFILNLEYYEHMQLYSELHASGQLEKYLADTLKRVAAGKQASNSSKTKAANTIYKIKTAAVTAATAVSIRALQQHREATDLAADNDKQKTKNLIRQISVNLHENLLKSVDLSKPSLSISPTISHISTHDSKRDSLQSIKSIILDAKRDSTLSIRSDLLETLNARILGDENWAPVRDQLILNQTPKQKRMDQMVS